MDAPDDTPRTDEERGEGVMAEDEYSAAVTNYYAPADLEATFRRALRSGGKELLRLTPDDLAPIDQFHVGGKEATLALARLASVGATDRVIDIGGGFGGTARTLAAQFGCAVTVLDLTVAYCQVGAMLTGRYGLEDRVTFRHGNALPRRSRMGRSTSPGRSTPR